MEETAREREANLKAIRQLAHDRRLKVNAMDEEQAAKEEGPRGLIKKTAKEEATALRIQKEGLERELNCLMFEWESFPKLMEEKGRIYLAEAKRVAELNDGMEAELGRRGIFITEQQEDGTMVLATLGDTADNRSSGINV
jgi:hypothetical protein